MKIARIDATPLAIPLGRSSTGPAARSTARTSCSSPCTPRTGSSATARRSARRRAPVAEVGAADRAAARRPLGRRRRGDPALGLDRGPLEDDAAVHAVRRRRASRPRAGTRSGARSACRRGTFFGGQVQERARLLRASCRATTPRRSRAHARQLAGHERLSISRSGGRGTTTRSSPRCARRSAPEPLLRIDPNEAWDAATAVDRIRRLAVHDLDWVEQPDAALGRRRARARAQQGRRQDRRRPGRLHDAASSVQVLEAEAADVIVQGPHDAGGLLRFRQQALMCDAHGG